MAPSGIFIRSDQAERSFSPGGRVGRNPREQNSLPISRARHVLSPPCLCKQGTSQAMCFLEKIFSQFFLSVKNPPAVQETQVWSPAREDPLEGGNHTPIFSPRNVMDKGDWQATVHGVARVGHDLATKVPPHILYFSQVCGMGITSPIYKWKKCVSKGKAYCPRSYSLLVRTVGLIFHFIYFWR